jgi:hypothetical protein
VATHPLCHHSLLDDLVGNQVGRHLVGPAPDLARETREIRFRNLGRAFDRSARNGQVTRDSQKA